MPHGRRRTPFSGKRKKEQLLAKRQRKSGISSTKDSDTDSNSSHDEVSKTNIQKINPESIRAAGRNRYALEFFKESPKYLALMRKAARDPIKTVELSDREALVDYFDKHDFPVRPPWNYSMSKEELELNENRYFHEYVKSLIEHHSNIRKSLSVFETNLETWRQFWRVLEISDIVLIIVDIRYSKLMFPPSLFAYITKTLGKDVVLILNKIDLVKPEIVVAWRQYFLETYPGLLVTLFTSYHARQIDGGAFSKRKRPMEKSNGECVLDLFKCVNNIVGTDLDLFTWEEKILSDLTANEQETTEDAFDAQKIITEESFEPEVHTKYKNGVVTIGCVGFPNVGKSSIINALKGRKVVSVSRTPGHTKYFQTIFLTKNVKLCDCPGTVFPSSLPKSVQVILGSYPISQLQEPYATIRYVGERLNLADILSITLPPDYTVWSPLAICEAWALKRGFLTAKAARPDTYRAANNILQLVLQGKISCDFFPPGFLSREDYWKNHTDLQAVRNLVTGPLKTCVTSDGKNRDSSKIEASSDSSSDGNLTAEESGSSDKPLNAFSLLDDE